MLPGQIMAHPAAHVSEGSESRIRSPLNPFLIAVMAHPSGDPGLSGMADIQAKASASQAYAWSKAFVNTDIKCPSFRTGI